ncbi:netrin receptor UNC5B-like [Penaeus japonicus]|uniref:netrin receptor UNC5B-like n=1 Tax=Penaeus japonicus TaxID=27405 RepID=UPI001C714C09|nr:netrin receptor UNC5B-like [Penaeus japonicus]
MTGVRVMEGQLQIERRLVEEFFDVNDYGCYCVAWSSRGETKSKTARVATACKFCRHSHSRSHAVSQPRAVFFFLSDSSLAESLAR